MLASRATSNGMGGPCIREAGSFRWQGDVSRGAWALTVTVKGILADMAENKRYPVVVRTEIDYKRAATLGNKLVVKGWLDKVERTRFWCAFEVTRPSDGTLIVQSRQMLALVQMPEGRPVRLPKDWDVRFKHLKP